MGGARGAFWATMALALVLLTARNGAVPLIDPDEPRFARTSVEMLQSGEYVLPQFEGRARLSKPPLLHWLQLPLFRIAGAGEWTARLPSMLAALGLLLVVGGVARRRYGDEGAAWAALILATMPLVLASGRLGTLDALLALNVFGAIALDMAAPGPAPPQRSAAIGALLGLAFLTKGPVGVLLPLLVMLAGRSATGRRVLPDGRQALAFAGGLLLVTLPWVVAFTTRIGWDQALALVRGEVLDRYFAGTAHVKPPTYYLPVLMIGMLPWFAPLVLGVVRVFGRRDDPAARSALYAAAGFLAGLVFFGLSKGKLPNYLLPLMPLGALLVTWELKRELEDARARLAGPLLLTVSLALFGLTLLYVSGRSFDAPVPQVALWGCVVYLAGAFVSLYGVLTRSPRFVFATAAVSAVGFLLILVTVLMPGLYQRHSSRELVRVVPELTSERPIVVVEMQLPSLTFYLDRIPEKIRAGEFAERLGRGDEALYVIDPIDFPLFSREVSLQLREVGRHGKYQVYERSDLTPRRDEG